MSVQSTAHHGGEVKEEGATGYTVSAVKMKTMNDVHSSLSPFYTVRIPARNGGTTYSGWLPTSMNLR